ncbi:hypothetical protein BH09VER1_BH09VER1_48400 [soil metagenome]
MTLPENSLTYWTLVACVVIGIPASLILGVSIGGKALRALRTGVAISASRAEYRRTDTPSLYWLTLSLQAFNTTACLLVAFALASFPVLAAVSILPHGPPRARAEAEMMAMEAAAESYQADHGHYPTGDAAAISKALTGDGHSNHKVYIEWPAKSIAPSGALLDPWGTPYRLKSGHGFFIQSAGPNKRFEDSKAPGSDDISTA